MAATISLIDWSSPPLVSFQEIHFLSRSHPLIGLESQNVSVADSLRIDKAMLGAVVTDGVGHQVQQVVREQQVREGQQAAQLGGELLQTVLRHVQTDQPP